MQKVFFLGFLILFIAQASAQKAPFVDGEIIVQLEAQMSPKVMARPLSTPQGPQYPQIKKCLSESMGIYLLRLESLSPSEALKQIRTWEGIQYAQLNHQLTQRNTDALLPNDPNFLSQWALNNTGQNGGNPDADIDAPEAWDLSTGGLSSQGDTLVIAVIDLGMDLAHEDLLFWKNHAEIPDNGLDDDGNGYVDDYHGWNANKDSDEILPDGHGTPVAGIIAADGNNGIGVAGVSWNTQIMPLINLLAVESEVVEAYGYVLEMRKRYNQTLGAEGAFVVATNSSFGVDRGNPANYPIWCSIYDSLGAQGVLNIAATTNAARNVDNEFDMPSGCQSDFLITVTNTTRLDSLNQGAGYGALNVDVGAPGTQVASTLINNAYGTRSGTSFSAPHVSGAMALLFSAACPEILTQYKRTPETMALEFKKWILQGVDPLASLSGKTVSGGRLNVYNSLLIQQSECVNYNLNCLSPTKIGLENLTDTSVRFNWASVGDANSYSLRYKVSGEEVWTETVQTDTFFQASGLLPCTDYVIQVATNCASDSSDFLANRRFKTEGCCEAPGSFQVLSIQENQVFSTWESVFGANYIVEYKTKESNTWSRFSIGETQISLANLLSCQTYQLRVGSNCGITPINYTDTLEFRTKGCGFCIDTDYCESKADISQFEWIEAVKIGPIQNTSGNNGGYAQFSDWSYDLEADSKYPMTLTHGFDALPGRQFWKIWIDANQDGILAEDGTELFFDSQVPIEGEFSDTLRTPTLPSNGTTLMRISMKFEGITVPVPSPEPCEQFTYGEVEDYCISLRAKGTVSLDPTKEEVQVQIFPNPFRENIRIESDQALHVWQLFDTQGRLIHRGNIIGRTNATINLSGIPQGLYYLRINSSNGTITKKIQKI